MRTRNTPTCEGKLGRQVSEKGLKNHSASPSPVRRLPPSPNPRWSSGRPSGAYCRCSADCRPPAPSRSHRRTARLHDDLSDAALPHAGVFAARGGHAVHHDARHRLHAVLPLAARLALDEPRQQLAVGVGHRLASLPAVLFISAYAPARVRVKIFLKMRELFSALFVKSYCARTKKAPGRERQRPTEAP